MTLEDKETNILALSIARLFVLDEMRRQNIKPSYVEAKEITKAARDLLATDEGKKISDKLRSHVRRIIKQARG